MFKVGDRVICIDSEDTYLEVGREYVITYVQPAGKRNNSTLVAVYGINTQFFESRFQLISQTDKSNIVWCLTKLRDTTNEQHVFDACTKALEEVDKLR